MLLAIRALGKSKFVLCQVPSHNRRPESAVLYLVDYSSNVVPSIKESYLLKWLNFEMFGYGKISYSFIFIYIFLQAWVDIIDCILVWNTYTVHWKKSQMEKMDPLNLWFQAWNGTQWLLFDSFVPLRSWAKMAWGMWNSLSNCMKPLILLRCSRGRFLISSEVQEKTGIRMEFGQTYWHNYVQFQTNCTCTRLIPSVSFCKCLRKQETWPRQVRLERERRGSALATVFEGFQMDRKKWTAGRTQSCLHL